MGQNLRDEVGYLLTPSGQLYNMTFLGQMGSHNP